MNESLPIAKVHESVLNFMRERDDAAMFGAHAVNAYVHTPRMTQGIDILTPNAVELTESLRHYLHTEFSIAVRSRVVAQGMGHRIYQRRAEGNRHLVDVRSIESLPACQRVSGILVLAPEELVASKVISMTSRKNSPKGMTDGADLMRLLLTFPELKTAKGAVADALQRLRSSDDVTLEWEKLVNQSIMDQDDDDY